MTYPKMTVNLQNIKYNLDVIVNKCKKYNIDIWAVTKGMSCPIELAREICEVNIGAIADSRLSNLINLKNQGINKELSLIRIPMLSELEQVVENIDYSLISEIDTLNEISKICESKRKSHKVLLMVDMGDLREGFWVDQVDEISSCVRNLSPAVEVSGIAVNYACASGVIPSKESLNKFVKFGEELENFFGYELKIYSGGATTQSLVSLGSDFLPDKINNLRIGEGYLLGTDTGCSDPIIPWLKQDTMFIEAELVEIKVKPSKPVGIIGKDAFGNIPEFVDRGKRKRGILALGKQDIEISGMTPLDEGVLVLAASSDHLIVDLENCRKILKVGDILKFNVNYPAMLRASTSSYVKKIYL